MTAQDVFVMLDGLSPFATEQEAVEWLRSARLLPQTPEVVRAIAQAERILREIQERQRGV